MKRALYLLPLAGFIADQTLKLYSQSSLLPHGEIFILGKWARVTYFLNYRSAFSLPIPLLYIIAGSVAALAFLGAYVWRRRARMSAFTALGYMCIIAGAISNLTDRIARGAVIDYIFIWPMSFFNIADMLILGGIACVIVYSAPHTSSS